MPAPDTAFYFASEEVLSKPGAEVDICYTRVRTTEEEADELEAEVLEQQALAGIRKTAADAAQVAVAAAGAVTPLVEPDHFLNARRQELTDAAQAVAQDGDVDGVAHQLSQVTAAMADAIADPEPAIDDLIVLRRLRTASRPRWRPSAWPARARSTSSTRWPSSLP